MIQVQEQSVGAFRAAFLRGLRPDEELTVSQWAAQHRVMTSRESNTRGPWRNERTPYLVEVMDALSTSHPCHRVTFMKGSQIGGTECGNNWLGYSIAHDPSPTLYVCPDLPLAKRASRQRVAPMIQACDELRHRVAPARVRDSGNTLLEKEFPGGMLVIVGANSGTGFRSMPARRVFMDEVDAFPWEIPGEGDPYELAERATRSFESNYKILDVSTPTAEGRSRIAMSFERSDRSFYFVPCPHCGEFQRLFWKDPEGVHRLRYETTTDADGLEVVVPGSIGYFCAACSALIEERHKPQMLAAGEWRSERPDRSRHWRGFHLSALYSPLGMFSWERVVDSWLRAQRNAEKLRVFVNQTLGEVYRDPGEAPDWKRLHERRDPYEIGKVPKGGLVLVAGVDVQGDRLECEVVAYGEDLESWSVDYVVIPGDPAEEDVWNELEKLRARSFPAEVGADRQIRMMAVDASYLTHHVYTWARTRTGQVMAVQGFDNQHTIVGIPRPVDVTIRGKRVKRGAKMWPVGVSTAKAQLYAWLRQAPPEDENARRPVGWCHFPEYGDEYFKQLCAERMTREVDSRTGRVKWLWEKTRERNEVLDCFDPETEVLTRSGWRAFADLTRGDELATIDLHSDEIQYQRPTELVSRQHDGEMVSIEGRRISILVTPGHRMVTYKKKQVTVARGVRRWVFDVPPEITLAEDLTIHHSLKLTGTWKGGEARCHLPASSKRDGTEIEPARELDPGDWAEFLGWWVSEGSACERAWGASIRRIVSLSQNQGPRLDAMLRLLDRLPWRYHIDSPHGPDSPGRRIVVTSKQLYDAVLPLGRLQPERRSPAWLKNAPPAVIERFIDAMVEGDGWEQRGGRTIATTSRLLADDLQELLIKLGRAANIRVRPAEPYRIHGRVGDNTRDQYHVSECRAARAYLDGGGGGRREFIGRRVPYSGMVYCASVPNGTLICRRNGRSFVAGNCRVYCRAAANVLQLDRLDSKQWDSLRIEVEGSPREAARKAGERPAARRRRRKGYLGRSRFDG